MEPARAVSQTGNDRAHIGRSVLVRGELSGSEDLYVDGQVEGSINLPGHSVAIGPNSRVKASISARHVVIEGSVEGNVNGSERVELKATARLVGDIATQRVSVEDGAVFKGSIEVQRPEPGSATKAAETAKPATESRPLTPAAASNVASSTVTPVRK